MSSNAIKCGVRAGDVDFGWHCKTSGISREDSGGIGQLWGGIEWILATSTLPGGVEQIWGGIANFLAVIFLLAAASRAALFALVSSFLAVVAFAAGNALLLSAVCGIRYRRGPPTVRKGYSVPETPFYGTNQDSLNRKRVSLALLRN